jgi:hypothetical protein
MVAISGDLGVETSTSNASDNAQQNSIGSGVKHTSTAKEEEVGESDATGSKENTACPDGGSSSEDPKDDDSTEAVGKEEASTLDQDMMDDDDAELNKANDPPDGNPRKVTTMFQKILSLGGGAGQVVVDVGSNIQPAQPGQNLGPDARQPTLVHQGRMVSTSMCSNTLCVRPF